MFRYFEASMFRRFDISMFRGFDVSMLRGFDRKVTKKREKNKENTFFILNCARLFISLQYGMGNNTYCRD